MTWILARTILLPIGLGLLCRAFFPAFADRVDSVLAMAGSLGLLVVVLFALAAFYPALLNMDAWSYLVIVAVCATALGIGHWSGPDQPEREGYPRRGMRSASSCAGGHYRDRKLR